jgi:hypothetical protein
MGKYAVTAARVPMYDGTDAAMLPAGTVKAAGYVNGQWPSRGAIQARFPQARVAGIDVHGDSWMTASVIDWEHGDVQDAATLRAFITNRNSFEPETACIYVEHASVDEVEDYAAGLWHVLWVANWGPDGSLGQSLTGTRTAAGNLIVATQLQNTPGYDMSDTLASW